jgi:hypothetical protein
MSRVVRIIWRLVIADMLRLGTSRAPGKSGGGPPQSRTLRAVVSKKPVRADIVVEPVNQNGSSSVRSDIFLTHFRIMPRLAVLEFCSGRRIQRLLAVHRAHLAIVLNWGLESPQNPQAGKPALRSADIPVGGFGRLSSRPLLPVRASRPRTVSRCTPVHLTTKHPLAKKTTRS